jgi:hypothetical protein
MLDVVTWSGQTWVGNVTVVQGCSSKRRRGMTWTVKKSLTCHLPTLTRNLLGESDAILKAVEDSGGENIVNAV